MIIFNDVKLSDYVIIMDIRRDISPPKDLVMQTVAGMKGSYLSRVETLSREVEVDVFFKEKTLPELRKAVRTFSGIVNTEEPKKMVFTHEPDVYYYGILTGQTAIQEIISFGKATLTFALPDPIAWGRTMNKSLNIQADSVTFSRDSVALNTDLTEVAINEPRYSAGKFGTALLLEEGTTNAIPQAKTMSSYKIENYTVDSSLTTIIDGVANLEFTRDAGTGDTRITGPLMSIDPTVDHVYSFEIKHTSGLVEMRIEGDSVSSQSSGVREIGEISDLGVFTPLKEASLISIEELPDGFKRYSILLPSGFFYKATGTSAIIQNRHGYSINGVHKYQFRKPQLEGKKIAPTSFTEVERKRETLNIPVSRQVSSAAGTWEHRFKLNLANYPIADTSKRTVWVIKGLTGPNAVSLDVTAGVFNVFAGGIDYPITLVDGWNEVGVAWTSTSLTVVVNGVEAYALTAIVIPDNFGGNAFVGADSKGVQANVFHDSVRISEVAKTSADIIKDYNKVWTLSGDTSVLMNFDSTLDWESGDTAEVNTLRVEGTAEPSPIVTVKVLSNAPEFKVTLDTGEFIRVATPIKAADVVVIDCTKNLVTINGVRAMEFLDLDSRFFELSLGVNTVTLAENLSADVTLDYVERWS